MKKILMILMVMMMLVGCGTANAAKSEPVASTSKKILFEENALLRFQGETIFDNIYDLDVRINDLKLISADKDEKGKVFYTTEVSYTVTNYQDELLDPASISLTFSIDLLKKGSDTYQENFLPKADMPSLRKGESAKCTQKIFSTEPKDKLELNIGSFSTNMTLPFEIK